MRRLRHPCSDKGGIKAAYHGAYQYVPQRMTAGCAGNKHTTPKNEQSLCQLNQEPKAEGSAERPVHKHSWTASTWHFFSPKFVSK